MNTNPFWINTNDMVELTSASEVKRFLRSPRASFVLRLANGNMYMYRSRKEVTVRDTNIRLAWTYMWNRVYLGTINVDLPLLMLPSRMPAKAEHAAKVLDQFLLRLRDGLELDENIRFFCPRIGAKCGEAGIPSVLIAAALASLRGEETEEDVIMDSGVYLRIGEDGEKAPVYFYEVLTDSLFTAKQQLALDCFSHGQIARGLDILDIPNDARENIPTLFPVIPYDKSAASFHNDMENLEKMLASEGL